ncbi:hypothetical protein V1512DRAFT_204420 [Lipomyces arxii]|uniref:uncharacterized protein n=1 Tax=Lipomyces arxii TaxID=56418 RepID=UPI0034CF64DC
MARQERIRLFEQEMHILAEQQRKDEQMILQMAAEETDNGTNLTTPISEPTTPPDYRDSLPPATGVGGDRIRSNTVPVGVAGLVTPNGVLRMSGNQLMTPPEDQIPRTRTLTNTQLGSNRRSSNDDPVYYATRGGDVDSVYSLGQINTTKFLFGDDGSSQANDLKFNDDRFPMLIRRESFNQASASQPPVIAQQQPPAGQQQQPNQQQQMWQFMGRRPGHQHSLSNVGMSYAEAQHDKRASVDMTSYQLFSGSGAPKVCSQQLLCLRMLISTAFVPSRHFTLAPVVAAISRR